MTSKDLRVYLELLKQFEQTDEIVKISRLINKLCPAHLDKNDSDLNFKIDTVVIFYYLRRLCANKDFSKNSQHKEFIAKVDQEYAQFKVQHFANSAQVADELEFMKFLLQNRDQGSFKMEVGKEALLDRAFKAAKENFAALALLFSKPNRIIQGLNSDGKEFLLKALFKQAYKDPQFFTNLVKDDSYGLREFSPAQLMALRVKHRTLTTVSDKFEKLLLNEGHSIRSLACTSLTAALVLFAEPNRVAQNLSAKQLAQIMVANLDKMTIKLVKVLSSSSTSALELKQKFTQYLHGFFLLNILASSSFPTLSSLVEDKEAAEILGQSSRLKRCIEFEQQLLEKKVGQEAPQTFLTTQLGRGQQQTLRGMRDTEVAQAANGEPVVDIEQANADMHKLEL